MHICIHSNKIGRINKIKLYTYFERKQKSWVMKYKIRFWSKHTLKLSLNMHFKGQFSNLFEKVINIFLFGGNNK